MSPGQRPRRQTCDGTSRVCRVALAVAMVETNVKMETRPGSERSRRRRELGEGESQCSALPSLVKGLSSLKLT
jgi:hypothetical protein